MDMLLAKKRSGDRKSWLESKGDQATIAWGFPGESDGIDATMLLYRDIVEGKITMPKHTVLVTKDQPEILTVLK